jgi:hypothetical protein
VIRVGEGRPRSPDDVPLEPPHNIFAVNRSIRNEARSFYFTDSKFQLDRVERQNEERFRRWISLLGDENSSRLSELTLKGTLWSNFMNTNFTSPHHPNTRNHMLEASFELTKCPPQVTVNILQIIQATDSARRRLRWRLLPRIVVKKAETELEGRLAGRMQASFGLVMMGGIVVVIFWIF